MNSAMSRVDHPRSLSIFNPRGALLQKSSLLQKHANMLFCPKSTSLQVLSYTRSSAHFLLVKGDVSTEIMKINETMHIWKELVIDSCLIGPQRPAADHQILCPISARRHRFTTFYNLFNNFTSRHKQ